MAKDMVNRNSMIAVLWFGRKSKMPSRKPIWDKLESGILDTMLDLLQSKVGGKITLELKDETMKFVRVK